MVKKKNTKGLEADAKPLDLLLLELPATVCSAGRNVKGIDYATGFYEGTREIEGKKCVVLNAVQKDAHSQPGKTRYPIEQIKSYEVVRRYSPNPNDGLDKIIAEVIADQRKSSGGLRNANYK